MLISGIVDRYDIESGPFLLLRLDHLDRRPFAVLSFLSTTRHDSRATPCARFETIDRRLYGDFKAVQQPPLANIKT